jgi:transcriptional regulator with XRE-family HTH domain
MKSYDFKKIKALRLAKGLSQEKISELMHMTQSNYCKIERGQKKVNSIQFVEKLGVALKMSERSLKALLTGATESVSGGIRQSEILAVEKLLSKAPLRDDEYVLLSTPVLDVDKFDFKKMYSGINLKHVSDDDPFPMHLYPPEVKIIVSSVVEIGSDLKEGISIWLGEKKLGVIEKHSYEIINPLLLDFKISRSVLIENEESIAGFFDTYMKVVLIGTNAVCRSGQFDGKKFKPVKLLTDNEIDEIDKY